MKNEMELENNYWKTQEAVGRFERRPNSTCYPHDIWDIGLDWSSVGLYINYCLWDQCEEDFPEDKDLLCGKETIENIQKYKQILIDRGLIKVTKRPGRSDHIALFDTKGFPFDGITDHSKKS